MELAEEAIEAAYQAHVTAVYKVFAQSILAAGGSESEITAAEDRFRKGLEFASEVRRRARAAAGLSG